MVVEKHTSQWQETTAPCTDDETKLCTNNDMIRLLPKTLSFGRVTSPVKVNFALETRLWVVGYLKWRVKSEIVGAKTFGKHFSPKNFHVHLTFNASQPSQFNKVIWQLNFNDMGKREFTLSYAPIITQVCQKTFKHTQTMKLPFSHLHICCH